MTWNYSGHHCGDLWWSLNPLCISIQILFFSKLYHQTACHCETSQWVLSVRNCIHSTFAYMYVIVLQWNNCEKSLRFLVIFFTRYVEVIPWDVAVIYVVSLCSQWPDCVQSRSTTGYYAGLSSEMFGPFLSGTLVASIHSVLQYVVTPLKDKNLTTSSHTCTGHEFCCVNTLNCKIFCAILWKVLLSLNIIICTCMHSM